MGDDPITSPHFENLFQPEGRGSIATEAHMTSRWQLVCEILEHAETMPAKHKSEYVVVAVKALAYECHAAGKAARALRSMPSKMKKKAKGHKPRKKRRAAT
jgi:hypothetical protein